MNNCSTRSHCIFNIHVRGSHNSGQSRTECVLRLVDLAGSERLGNSETGTVLFNEGRNINLSLHYLEQVIVALNERVSNKRRHIPYRNSVLTWILRDSLGGNCSTSMIANISTDDDCFGESLSTCRFAKRVSSVENGATVNEVVDPQKIITRLTNEVEYLRNQLESLQSAPVLPSTVTESELDTLKTDIEQYLRGPESSKFHCDNLSLVR
jgi:kinesin family protein 6/9